MLSTASHGSLSGLGPRPYADYGDRRNADLGDYVIQPALAASI
jgi:hypothetical protein